jgi:hypothetical protein
MCGPTPSTSGRGAHALGLRVLDPLYLCGELLARYLPVREPLAQRLPALGEERLDRAAAGVGLLPGPVAVSRQERQHQPDEDQQHRHQQVFGHRRPIVGRRGKS